MGNEGHQIQGNRPGAPASAVVARLQQRYAEVVTDEIVSQIAWETVSAEKALLEARVEELEQMVRDLEETIEEMTSPPTAAEGG